MSDIKVKAMKERNTYTVTHTETNERNTVPSGPNEQELRVELEKEFEQKNYNDGLENFQKTRPKWIENDYVIDDVNRCTKDEILNAMIAQLADIDCPIDARISAKISDNKNEEDKEDLFDAIRDGQYEIIKNQLDVNKEKVNMRDGESLSLLHWSAIEGQVKIGEYLLANNAQVDIVDSNGFTPLHYACMCRHVDMVALLLDRAANAMAGSNDHLMPGDLTEDEHIKFLLNRKI